MTGCEYVPVFKLVSQSSYLFFVLTHFTDRLIRNNSRLVKQASTHTGLSSLTELSLCQVGCLWFCACYLTFFVAEYEAVLVFHSDNICSVPFSSCNESSRRNRGLDGRGDERFVQTEHARRLHSVILGHLWHRTCHQRVASRQTEPMAGLLTEPPNEMICPWDTGLKGEGQGRQKRQETRRAIFEGD